MKRGIWLSELRMVWAFLLSVSLVAPAIAAEAAPGRVGDSRDEDPRVAWLSENALPLTSIDPSNEDFSDLEPLASVLDGVEMVLLGEQSHGDGTTFLAKGRLIRYLHQELGFDVLAFESGLYDCAKAWERIEAGDEPVEAVGQGVFSIWTRSRQVQPTLEYVAIQAKGERPLELAGFDSQFTGRASREHLIADLEALTARLEIPLTEEASWKGSRAVLESLVRGEYAAGEAEPPSASEQRAFRHDLKELGKRIGAAAGPDDREAAFWRQLLRSIAAYSRSSWEIDRENFTGDPSLFELRDLQMGENLVWLARERFPGRKIIVWAATFHNARNLGSIRSGPQEVLELYEGIDVMGDVVARELGAKAYSLGFTAHEGRAGSVFGQPRDIHPMPPGSFEDLCHRAGLENAWVDFRNPPPGGEWLGETLESRPLGYSPMGAPWNEIVDGMLFTRTMIPSERVEREGGPRPIPWSAQESFTEDTLHNGFFLDPRNGWLISHNSGKVWRTKDGGKGWTQIADLDDGYLETIRFLDEKRGFLSGDGGRVLVTKDGGESWKPLSGLPASAAFYSVHFFDRKRGFVAGVDTATGQGLLQTTDDGGKSWTDRSTEVGAGLWTDALQVAPEGVAIVGGRGALVRTEDGGRSWKRTEVPGEIFIRGLQFTGTTGWVVGHGGKLLSTQDGGQSWDERPPLPARLLRSVLFPAPRTGFIVGSAEEGGPSLFVTRDGGESWNPAPGDFPDLHRLLLTPRRLLAIGADGTILAAGE